MTRLASRALPPNAVGILSNSINPNLSGSPTTCPRLGVARFLTISNCRVERRPLVRPTLARWGDRPQGTTFERLVSPESCFKHPYPASVPPPCMKLLAKTVKSMRFESSVSRSDRSSKPRPAVESHPSSKRFAFDAYGNDIHPGSAHHHLHRPSCPNNHPMENFDEGKPFSDVCKVVPGQR